jgi:hypothetical protein
MHIYLLAVGLLLCLIDFPCVVIALRPTVVLRVVGGGWAMAVYFCQFPNWVNLADQFRENIYTLLPIVFRSNLGALFVNIVDVEDSVLPSAGCL